MGDFRKLSFWLFFAPFLLWTLLLIILPQLEMLKTSFTVRESWDQARFGIVHYQSFFEAPYYWHALLRTALMSLLATFLTLLIGFPVAWYIARVAQGRPRYILFAACLIPFWASELVRVYGWMMLLRESGLISQTLLALGWVNGPVELLYNDVTVMIGLIYNGLLFMVVPLITTLEGLDPQLAEAGHDLGGSRLRVLFDIIVPWAMPGILSGCIIVFMLSLGNYLTPVLMGGKDSTWFTAQIFTQFITRFNWEQGAALGVILLVLSSVCVWLSLRLTGQSFVRVMQ